MQLLKATKKFESGYVRPFVAFLNVMNKIVPGHGHRKYLSDLEFTYLLPMCVDAMTTNMIVGAINKSRDKGRRLDVDAAIVSVLMGMANYQEALRVFRCARVVDEDLICLIGINRKSGARGTKRYDSAYFEIFEALHDIACNGETEDRLKNLVNAIEALNNGKVKAAWKGVLFNVVAGKRLPKRLSPVFRRDNIILKAKNEDEFRRSFLCSCTCIRLRQH